MTINYCANRCGRPVTKEGVTICSICALTPEPYPVEEVEPDPVPEPMSAAERRGFIAQLHQLSYRMLFTKCDIPSLLEESSTIITVLQHNQG